MAEEFRLEKPSIPNSLEVNQDVEKQETSTKTQRIIDETNYKVHVPRENGPTAIGRGGDELYSKIKASPELLQELMEETQTIQDWVQKETCNNVAVSCLENHNLREIYDEFKNGFGEYGKVTLMGFKTPSGVEIPRLKVFDKNGDVLQVLTGDCAIEELNKRAIAYRENLMSYEEIQLDQENETNQIIADYSGNPNDYVT